MTQKWYRVEFVAPSGMKIPLEAQGRWWHERSVHVLPEGQARTLAARPHFTLLNETDAPAMMPDCNCGKAKG